MKAQADVYVVSTNGERGTFFIRSGERYGNTWLQLTVNSTFGTFGHTFGSIGGTPAEFLAKVSFEYLVSTLFGPTAYVFDASTAARSVREIIIEHRRGGDLTKDQARELWEALEDAIGDYSTNEEMFFQALAEEPLFIEWEVWDIERRVPNPQAVGFWKELWPLFLADLQATNQAVAA